MASIDVMQAFCSEPPVLDFVIPGFLSGTTGCIASAGATGKSFFALQMAMSVASEAADQKLLNLGVKHHGPVLILNAEDPEIVLQRRLWSIGSHLSQAEREEVNNNLAIETLVGMMPDLMDRKWQETVLKAATGMRLVVFDTLTRWHKRGEMTSILMCLLVVKQSSSLQPKLPM